MKKIIFSLLLLISFASFAQEFPAKPTTLVNDYTNTLSATEKQQLESKLVAFDDSTSIQLAVVLIKSVGEYDINEYALGLGRKWGIGGKEKNTGVLVLVAIGDRKISIQTGYGMEGVIPDVYTKRIIENDIKPLFKDGKYYEGLDAGVNSLISLSKGEYTRDTPVKRKNKQENGGSAIIVIIIIIAIIIAIKRGGGGGGGGGSVIDGRGVSNALLWGLLLGGGGRSGGGSGFGGGGGFGGFGGGSFGGGGSSGSW